MKGILEAYLAAYQVRRGKKPGRNAHYLSNLPIVGKNGKPIFGAEAEAVDLPAAVERLIRRVELPDSEEIWPQFAARNLYEFLEEESFGIEAMNRALRPYWAVLWRAVARGHYLVRGYPVRDASRSAASEHLLLVRAKPQLCPLSAKRQWPRDTMSKVLRPHPGPRKNLPRQG